MYNSDYVTKERFESRIQTKANNTDPHPLIYIMHNKTPISSQRFWEKQRITDDVGTRSSIAVRRNEGSFLGDEIFTAQIESGDAILRRAYPQNNIQAMEWTTFLSIPNVSEISMIFDGYMKSVDTIIESYTIGDLPIVFFVDTDGSLKMINLDTSDDTITISDDAVNIASVRGLFAESISLDDGILCYYTNSEGELWEAVIKNNEVSELTKITLKPDGVTSWVDVWAGRTFDYRILLQLKADDGKVYTLISKSRPSGYSNLEYLSTGLWAVSGQIGTEPPNLILVDSVGVEI